MIKNIIAKTLPHLPPKLVWIFSKRYIAGVKIEDALSESRSLNHQGILVTVDLLGEYITDLKEAKLYKNQYQELMERFTSEGIQGNFSVKPSMFGLLLDKEACYQNLRDLVQVAERCNSFVKIDMEDSQCTSDEIALYKRLQAEFPNRVGLVLQAYMRRTMTDLIELTSLNRPEAPLVFRLCKGIYIEPEHIAYQGKEEIRHHYLRDLEYMLDQGMYPCIATHDSYLVEKAIEMIRQKQIPKDRYEFQMLFGVAPQLRKRIVDEGHAMRVYVPYGEQWFGYSTRRLKENPDMVFHIIKALFVRA